MSFAPISASASGDNVIVQDPGNGSKVKVISYVLVADGAVNAQWKGTGTASGAMPLVANSGVSANGGFLPMFQTTGGLILNLSAAVGVKGHVAYVIEQ